VVAKIFDRLPDETWVYPGHGGDTTLGAERPHLEEWREVAANYDAQEAAADGQSAEAAVAG
jgi:glyoxylase-like metal-dependent hydrolase (beta-lactamase superfamily II)